MSNPNKIDGELLTQAIEEIALEQMYNELREAIVYSSPTVSKVFSRYLELMTKKQDGVE